MTQIQNEVKNGQEEEQKWSIKIHISAYRRQIQVQLLHIKVLWKGDGL